MNFDDFFDGDFEAEEAAMLGGFFALVEDEEEEERKRKKLEREILDLDDTEKEYDDDCL